MFYKGITLSYTQPALNYISQGATVPEEPAPFSHMTCWLRAAVADSSLLRRWKTRLRFCFSMKLQWFAAVLCLGARAMAGKYSREVNEPRPGGADDEQTVEFRIAKLNQVWEKAKRVRTFTTHELHSGFGTGDPADRKTVFTLCETDLPLFV